MPVTYCPQRLRTAWSALESTRQKTPPELPAILKGEWLLEDSEPVAMNPKFTETIKALFPATNSVPKSSIGSGKPVTTSAGLKVGVVLSGGQAPGGHNVIAGLYDATKRTGPGSEFYGFIDGPHGVFSGNVTIIDDAMMDGYRNTGGFDMIGSGRHKIETDEQFAASRNICAELNLDGLVVIGGDDSNTNAALLAENFAKEGCKTRVVGCPKTIDGDLKCPPEIPVSFGFDTACRTYAELVGNVGVDALSTQKYYHFCRLMGRSASNIALEVALLTHPNVCLLGEEVQTKDMSLKQITDQLVDVVRKRSADGKNYGLIILPEGLIEFIPEFNTMIAEINELGDGLKEAEVVGKLSPLNAEKFKFLPNFIREQLLLDRDPHGNVQVAKIETERLLASCIQQELARLTEEGEFKGTFTPQFHAYGYEGRAGLPSRFDATYCYALGYTAGVLLAAGKTGLISSVKNLTEPVEKWGCGGVPVTSLCVVERRKGKDKPVIRKALVELEGPLSQPFKAWVAIRDILAVQEHYRNPGPLQFDNSCPTSLDLPKTLALELGGQLEPLDPAMPQPISHGGFLYCPRPLSSRSALQQWRIDTADTAPTAINVTTVTLARGGATRPPTNVDEDAIRKALPSTVGAPLVEILTPQLKKRRIDDGAATGSTDQGISGYVQVEGGKVGLVFCGRQAPGGHDVIYGALEAMRQAKGELYGFVGGAKGLLKGNAILLSDVVNQYRRSPGFDLLGRTVDSVANNEEDMAKALASCKSLGLTGLVLVGGTRTATDGAFLSEYFAANGSATSVVVVPCGIEGSFLNPFVEASLGFDSASKCVAQLVGNICTDGASARKYYYFIRCMDGSSTGLEATSHLTLEVALAVQPNVALIGEEVFEKRWTLATIVDHVADAVCARSRAGKNFGTVLVPEGLLACVPELRVLMGEIGHCKVPCTVEEALPQLSAFSAALLQTFPLYIQKQLLLERQSNGQIQLTQVQTEQLIADMVAIELSARKLRDPNSYTGTFSAVCEFIGYQARCCMPSNFDSCLGRTLGRTAGILANNGNNGYIASVHGLAAPVESWRCAGAPISSVCSNTDKGVRVPPRAVLLRGREWKSWEDVRAGCVVEDLYCNPGPIQFAGEDADRVNASLMARVSKWGEQGSYLATLDELALKIKLLEHACRPGCDMSLARVANRTLSSIEEIISLMKHSE